MKNIPHPKVNPYEADRKNCRLPGYDYSHAATYFVTFCTKDRVCYFGDIVDGRMHYSQQGVVADMSVLSLQDHNPEIEIYNYVIMPDHVHMLLRLTPKEVDVLVDGKIRHRPKTLSSIIGNYKAAVSRHCHRLGFDMNWLGSFFDHITNDDNERQAIDKYINNNVFHWPYASSHLEIGLIM